MGTLNRVFRGLKRKAGSRLRYIKIISTVLPRKCILFQKNLKPSDLVRRAPISEIRFKRFNNLNFTQ